MSICNIIKFVEGLENIEEIDKILEVALNQRRKMYSDWGMIYLA